MAKKKSPGRGKSRPPQKWTEKLAQQEFKRAKDWARNIRLEGEEAPPMILLLAISRKKRAIEALPIPEMILKGGGASISNFTRFLIAKTEPDYMILILEAWMSQYEEDPEGEIGEIIPPSKHPQRVETIIALLSSPEFEIMSTAPIIGGVPQEWEDFSGFEGRFSRMYGIEWGEA